MNIRRQINSKSNPTKIIISGMGHEVKEDVYRLFNNGVITGMPDELKECDYERVQNVPVTLVCNTYRKKFIGGLRSMAEIGMGAEYPRPKAGDKQGRREWHGIATVRAAHLHRSLFTAKTPKQERQEQFAQ